MSLYNAIFGENQNADTLLAALNLRKEDIPRYRDCYLEGDEIVVYTRTGGGNREYYEAENQFLREMEGFISDEDDDYDCTFANFRYKASESILSTVAPSTAPKDKWASFMSDLESNKDTPEVERAKRVGDKILNSISSREQIIYVDSSMGEK